MQPGARASRDGPVKTREPSLRTVQKVGEFGGFAAQEITSRWETNANAWSASPRKPKVRRPWWSSSNERSFDVTCRLPTSPMLAASMPSPLSRDEIDLLVMSSVM